MALSQDEQRVLAEIERRLITEDPGLASSLTTFRRPGTAKMMRSPRARIVGSLFTVLLVAMVSLTVYAMIPFRAHLSRQSPPSAGVPATTAMSAATSAKPSTAQPSSAQQSEASTNVGATASSASSATAAATAAARPQQSSAVPTDEALLPASTKP